MGDESEVRVLVVDDDAASLEATRIMLSVAGFEVRGANNGAVGLEEVLRYRPDVVVFDFWMPVADGRELLQGIREVARGRLGLVAMSGTPEVEDWCSRVGVSQFVRKPFARADLVAAVQRALEEARTTSVRSRVPSQMPVAHQRRVDRAVMLVGPHESTRPIRDALRATDPLQVAVVQDVDDAIRALESFRLDALMVCGSSDHASLPQLVAAATVQGLPVLLDRAPQTALGEAKVEVASSADSDRVVALIREVVARR
jgi:CheY-like chemotaxis protein